MLIEHRRYTPRPGQYAAFIAAQHQRGFAVVRPILERLIGYFVADSGPTDEVVHLYRFDSYDDWTARLHGLYGVPALQPYFVTVRPLLLAQENKFLAPAPVAELTPHWGNGRDWLPSAGPLLGSLSGQPDLIIEETTLRFAPGGLVPYWQAWRDGGLGAGPAVAHNLGVFISMVGPLHELVQYRCYPSHAARRAHREALADSAGWRALQQAAASVTAATSVQLLRPVTVPEMSPLFAHGS